MERYIEFYQKAPDVVISGFHMMKKGEYLAEEIGLIQETAEKLKKYRTKYYTCHCTGERAYAWMKEILHGQIQYVHCGEEIEIKDIRESRGTLC